MKKIILVFAAVAITAGAYAQVDSTIRKSNQRDLNNNQNQNMQSNPQDLNKTQKENMQSNPQDLNRTQKQNLQKNPVDQSYPDGILMQNGKLVRVKNGQITIFQENDVTMSNGTKILKDGTFIKKDGTKLTLTEGQHMDMSGNLIPMKTEKDKNMYLVPDSTLNKNK